jgi:hypothetical protein
MCFTVYNFVLFSLRLTIHVQSTKTTDPALTKTSAAHPLFHASIRSQYDGLAHASAKDPGPRTASPSQASIAARRRQPPSYTPPHGVLVIPVRSERCPTWCISTGTLHVLSPRTQGQDQNCASEYLGVAVRCRSKTLERV